jgi:hypothetical protein
MGSDLSRKGAGEAGKHQKGMRKNWFLQAAGPDVKETIITAGPVMRNHIKEEL